MACINTSLPQFKTLSKSFASESIAYVKTLAWQAENKTDEIPSFEQIQEMEKSMRKDFQKNKKEFNKKIINNLQNNNLVTVVNDVVYVKTEKKDEAFLNEALQNKINLIQNFLNWNNIPQDYVSFEKGINNNIKLKFNLKQKDKKLLNKVDFKSRKTKKIFDVLLNKMPVDYQYLSIEEAEEIYNNIPDELKENVEFFRVKAFFDPTTKQVILIKGRVNDKVALEEVLHPFVAALKNENIELFSSLVKESKKLYPEVFKFISDNYEYDIEEEMVTKALSESLTKKQKKKTPGLINSIKNFLKWLAQKLNIVNYSVSGKNIEIPDINAKTTLDDLVEMLNNDDLIINFSIPEKMRVKYALDAEKKKVIDEALLRANSKQKAIIYDLFSTVLDVDSEYSQFTAKNKSQENSIVVLNEENHTYRDVVNNIEYIGSTSTFNKPMDEASKKYFQFNIDMGNIYDYILENIILNVDSQTTLDSLSSDNIKNKLNLSLLGDNLAEQQEQVQKIYDFLQESLNEIISDGEIILPQVVVHQRARNVDAFENIAGTIDLLVITPEGKLRIIDLKTSKNSVYDDSYNRQYDIKGTLLSTNSRLFPSKFPGRFIDRFVDTLSTRQKHELQLAMYAKMLENMGYEIDHETPYFTFNIQIGVEEVIDENSETKQQFTGEMVSEGMNAKKVNVDELNITKQPASTSQIMLSYLIEDFSYTKEFEEMSELTEEEQLPEKIETEDSYTELKIIQNQLQKYEGILVKRYEAVKEMKSKIFIESDKKEYLKKIDYVMGLITQAIVSDNLQEARLAYFEVLKNANEQSDLFIQYLSDIANLYEDENKYLMYTLNADKFAQQFESLHLLTDKSLLSENFSKLIFDLQDKLNQLTYNDGKSFSLTQQALFDYVKQKIESTTSQTFDDGELDQLLRESLDISNLELYTRDMATSRNVLARTLDKIYKSKKIKLQDEVVSIQQEILFYARKLYEISPEKDPQKLYDYFQYEDGAIVQKESKEFIKKRREIRSKLFDENSNWKEYIVIDDIQNATKEQIEYNKELAKLKAEHANFMAAEKITEDGEIVDGDHYQYTEEFKREREKYERLVLGRSGNYYWKRKINVSDRAFNAYQAKYYTSRTRYMGAVYNNGKPTGMTQSREKRFVKKEFITLREYDSNGNLQFDERYSSIMNPKDELGIAQKEYYEMYINMFNKLNELLPAGQKFKIMGRMPVVRNRYATDLQNKSGIVLNLFTKLKDSFNSLKSFFTDTTQTRAITMNEFGELVNSPPIFYTGGIKDEARLQEIDEEIENLKQQRKIGQINFDVYDTKIKLLKGERNKIQNQPSFQELDRDATSNLMKYADMAMNYHYMNEAENVFNAFLSVVEKMKFTPKGPFVTGFYKGKEFRQQGVIEGKDSNVYKRIHKYLEMNIWESDKVPKSLIEKIVASFMKVTSLTFVAFNPFSSLNNYLIGKVGNYNEAVASRYFDLKDYLWAEKEFKTNQMPAMIKRVSSIAGKKKSIYDPKYPMSKYEAFVNYMRMMDSKADLREADIQGNNTYFKLFIDFGYFMQDSGEYINQTKVGMSVLKGIIVQDEQGNLPEISLYDAYVFDPENASNQKSGLRIKEGYENAVVIKTPGQFKSEANLKEGVPIFLNDDFRYNVRNYIREAVKQIHGNYAKPDKMVIESHAAGKALAQFHKWVAPTFAARFQEEYYDENLGWVEGKWRSAWKVLKYFMDQSSEVRKDYKNIKENFIQFQIGKESSSWKTLDPEKRIQLENQLKDKYENQFKGMQRLIAEFSILFSLWLVKSLIDNLLSDDDDEIDLENYTFHPDDVIMKKELSPTMKRLSNILKYQSDRVYKDFSIYLPLLPSSLGQLTSMVDSPFAIVKNTKEYAQFFQQVYLTPMAYMLQSEEDFWNNSNVVYQRGSKKGRLKLAKEFGDITTIVRSIQKWFDFENQTNYFIK